VSATATTVLLSKVNPKAAKIDDLIFNTHPYLDINHSLQLRSNHLDLSLRKNVAVYKYRAITQESRHSHQVVFWMPVTTHQFSFYAQS
jgi:hypothetical protein